MNEEELKKAMKNMEEFNGDQIRHNQSLDMMISNVFEVAYKYLDNQHSIVYLLEKALEKAINMGLNCCWGDTFRQKMIKKRGLE